MNAIAIRRIWYSIPINCDYDVVKWNRIFENKSMWAVQELLKSKWFYGKETQLSMRFYHRKNLDILQYFIP